MTKDSLNIFEKILAGAAERNFKPNSRAAAKWFKERVSELGRIRREKTILNSLSDRKTATMKIGEMYMFLYDAKTKDELPYWDRFPLVFPIERYKDGFLGINLHYLPIGARATLMNALTKLATDNRFDKNTKLMISYQILKNFSKHSLVQPCIKRYLYSHMRSAFTKVYANEWQIAIYLPLERFTQNKASVWKSVRAKHGIKNK